MNSKSSVREFRVARSGIAILLVLMLMLSMSLPFPQAFADDSTDLTASGADSGAEGDVIVNGPEGDVITDNIDVQSISSVVRISGSNRNETAVKASQAAFPGTASTAIVAYSDKFPDALAASALAGATTAPILLTGKNTLDSYTAGELTRLTPKTVYILGSADSISANVEAAIAGLPSTPVVIRLGGNNRYETAKLIADEAVKKGAKSNQIFLVNGENFPDALSVGSFSASQKVPILLANANGLGANATNFITQKGVKDVVIAGNSKAVISSAETTLKNLGVTSVNRYSGDDRYGTSANVVYWLLRKYGMQVPNLVGVASGDNFPDALAGGASIGIRKGVLLITPANALRRSAYETLHSWYATITRAEVYGGTTTLAKDIDSFVVGATQNMVSPAYTESYGAHANVNKSGGAYLRNGPSTSYSVITKVPNKAEVVETGYQYRYSANTWFYVRWADMSGWIEVSSLRFQGGMAKPVIYLYPTEPTDVQVKISFQDGHFTYTEPADNNGWLVRAQPNGQLHNYADGQSYPYLYWEADAYMTYDTSSGFVVQSAETETFLRDKLAYQGLSLQEIDDFMDYWLPILVQNPYNLITFQGQNYLDAVQLDVQPKPDSVLRVFMAYKPLDQPIQIPQQQLTGFNRSGFTVVEWGGGEIPFLP